MKDERKLRKKRVIDETSAAVAEKGLPLAKLHNEIFSDLLKTKIGITVNYEQFKGTLAIFSFLVWAYHYGAWSNLKDMEYRTGLIKESYNKMILAAAYEITESKAVNDSVEVADSLHALFDVFYKKLLLELPAKYDAGYKEDLSTFLYIGLDWLKDLYWLSDFDLEIIAPLFVQDKRVDDSLGEVEKFAFRIVSEESKTLRQIKGKK